MSRVEIHFHLLPGIDDGPRTLAESVSLAAAAAADGTGTIIATPHINHHHGVDVASLPARRDEVAEALDAAGVPVRVLLGGELSHHRVPELTQAELDTVANGPRDARFVLLEASLDGLDPGFTEVAELLRRRGFGVVMAHPERSLARANDAAWAVVEREIAAGSAFQVNAWSLAGRYGDPVRNLAFRVLDATPAAIVASDAHGGERMPALELGLRALEAAGDRLGPRRMAALPQALLERGVPARGALAA